MAIHALIYAVFAQIIDKEVGELMVFQSPVRGDEQVFWRLRGKSLKHQRGAQMTDVFGQKPDVFVHGLEGKRLLDIGFAQPRVFGHLQLMYLENVETGSRNQ